MAEDQQQQQLHPRLDANLFTILILSKRSM
jgi:hypothetical protein